VISSRLPGLRRLLPALVLVSLGLARGIAADELDVLEQPGSGLLYEYLLEQVERQAAVRNAEVQDALRSPEALAARRQRLRQDLRKIVGPLPERTPLEPRVTGTIDCEGYRIEKVLIASRPGHHVTANLYLPADTSRPSPGVLVPCGHSANGKASEAYQSACVLLAKNGLVALIYDPIGQGERNQLPPSISHGTHEHTLVGIGALAVGLNTGHYRIWDGLRAMDYLASRPEVDPKRLGCAGNSGGGTMTTWLMALDERIEVAAPSCFITTIPRLFKTIGPQDCEQHFPGQGKLGIDHTDFIAMRAPRPTLILAAEQDFFDFEGTRTAYEQAAAVYRVFGKPEQVSLFSYNDKHGWSQPRREAAVQWMRRWLMDDDRPVREPKLTLQKDADLQVTASGQVVGEFVDEVSVVDLNQQAAERLASERRAAWDARSPAERVAAVREVLGIAAKPAPPMPATSKGLLNRDGYTIEKLAFERSGEVPLPALLCLPEAKGITKPLRAVIYVDSRGKSAGFGAGGAIERLIRDGNAVLAVDLRGFGETADTKEGRKYHNAEFRTAMVAMHVGRPLLAKRVEDLLAVVDWLATDSRIDSAQIGIIGVRRAGPVVLHAAVLEKRIAPIELRDSIRSWQHDVVAKPLDADLMGSVVPGSLAIYDLPDLAAMLGERFKAGGAD